MGKNVAFYQLLSENHYKSIHLLHAAVCSSLTVRILESMLDVYLQKKEIQENIIFVSCIIRNNLSTLRENLY